MLTRSMQHRLVKMARSFVVAKVAMGLTPKRGEGSFKAFYPMSESWGIKLCHDGQNDINRRYFLQNYMAQRRASRFGLGPICFGLRRVGDYCYYITQTVQVGTYTKDEKTYWKNSYRDWRKFHNIRHLCYKLYKYARYNFEDTKPANMGLHSGKSMCIDFDVLGQGMEPIIA